MKQWLLSVKSNKVKYILIFCVAMQVLCTVLCLANFVQVRNMGEKELSAYSDQLAEAISKDFQRNNVYLEATVFDSYFRKMSIYSGMEWVTCVSRLQEMFTLCNGQSRTSYYFFVADEENGIFLETVAVRMPFEAYRPIRAALLEQINSETENGVYRLMTLEDGTRIIYAICKYDSFACCCWVTEDVLRQNTVLQDSTVPYRISLTTDGTGIPVPMVNAQFRLQLQDVNSSGQRAATVMALLQTILSLSVVVLLSAISNTVNQKLLIPAQSLTEILEKYNTDPEACKGMDWRNVINDAAVVLERLGMQVDSLNLKLAESEVEKQKLNLNFRSLQIRPHFLVNSLAMINGMAQVGAVDEIKEITVRLSDYYRYVLRDVTDTVPLELELSHLRNLFEVTQQWNGNPIHTKFQVEDEVKAAQIPVLLISTFAENSIKYALDDHGELNLEIVCGRLPEDRDTLCIQVMDNGGGFPQEVLDNFGHLEQLAGRRIGISNCLRRLELLYGSRASICASNRDTGGARVTIHLPLEVRQ